MDYRSRTMRLSIDDKADWVYYQSKFDKRKIAAIKDIANEAANRIRSNADLNTARELIGIENAAQEIAQSQIDAAYIIESSIKASTDRITAGQNKIVCSIEDLRSLFDARSAQIIWLLEQQHKELMNLLGKMYETMITPTETDAKEKTKWAINAYNNGWFDQAIECFNKSKKLYPFDFMVYLFLGNIYLFEMKNSEKALKNYKLALKYMSDRSRYYKSIALLHIGLSHYEMGDYQDAYIAAANAIQINSNLSEAYYRCAQYCSKLGRYDEAINYLKTAIDADRGYSLKALAEQDFAVMSSKFKDLMENLTREEKSKADTEIKKFNQLINIFNDIGVTNDVKEKIEEGITLNNAGTYLDHKDAKYKAKASQKALVDSLISKLSFEMPNLETQFIELKGNFEKNSPALKEFRKATLVSFPMAILGYGVLYEMIYDEGPPLLGLIIGPVLDGLLNGSYLPEFLHNILFIFIIIICPFAMPLFFIFLIKYIMLPKAPSIEKIGLIEKELTRIRRNLAMVEAEKRKLNIDKHAEPLNYIDYEKYLRKNYG